MGTITDVSWWKAAMARAFRTAAVVAIPYVPVTLGDADYLILASALGMGFILSIITSLAGIAEADGKEQPWWFATLSRVVKTTSQALVTAVGSAVLFTDVDWSIIPALVVSSAVGSLLLAVVKQLPEAPAPTVASPVEIVGVTAPTGDVVATTTNNVTVVAATDADPQDVADAVAESLEPDHGYHGE